MGRPQAVRAPSRGTQRRASARGGWDHGGVTDGGGVMSAIPGSGRVGTYAALGGRDRRWQPPARHLLAGLLAVEALLACAFAIWPPAPANRTLDAVLAGMLALAAAGCALTWRHRGPLGLLEACLVLAWGMPMVLIATRAEEASQVLWAAIVLLVAVVAALYLPARTAVHQVAIIVVVYLVAALAFEPPTRPVVAGGFAVVTVLAAFAVAWVRADRDRLVAAIGDMAVTDPLTGLLNRRGLDSEAAAVHANTVRAGRPTVVALLDVDGLKRVNDLQGHDAGDRLIVGVADHLRDALRLGDLIARVGGDEFVVVLPHADADAAADLLTRVRDSAPGSWSQGWTMWAADEDLDAAIGRADALMYADKSGRRAGRDDAASR